MKENRELPPNSDEHDPPDNHDDTFPFLPFVLGSWLGRKVFRVLVEKRRPSQIPEWERTVVGITTFVLYAFFLFAYFWMDLPEGNRKLATVSLVVLTPTMWKIIKYYWSRLRGRKPKERKERTWDRARLERIRQDPNPSDEDLFYFSTWVVERYKKSGSIQT